MHESRNGKGGQRAEKSVRRVVWKKEKVNKREMPSHTHAGKVYRPSPSSYLDFQSLSEERQLPASGVR